VIDVLNLFEYYTHNVCSFEKYSETVSENLTISDGH